MSLTNAQADAAESVRALVAASDPAAVQSIEKAIEAGHALIVAKESAPHGTWLPFLERAEVQERKAQRLMKLAASGLKSDTVTDLGGITGALRFLSERRLPEAGHAIRIYPDDETDYTFAAYILGSIEAPGYFYAAVSNDDHIVVTPRPMLGQAIHFPGEEPFFALWEWVRKHFDIPEGRWKFAKCSEALAYTMFGFHGWEEALVQEKDSGNFANAAGMRSFLDQRDALKEVRLAEAA
ncbi:hypothetical protein [Pelagibacterium mangrovi]|uniref:hypothetical protein n=1 Tax=Pelagibacterium mangrovi TaxID=3119828 RepID=UPI002FC8D339